MKKKKLSNRRLTYWINRFDWACKDLAFIGASHPSTHKAIKEEYRYVRKKLFQLMKGEL